MATRLYVARLHLTDNTVAPVGGARLSAAPEAGTVAAGWEDSTTGTWSGVDRNLWLTTSTTEGRTDAQTLYAADKGSTTTDRDTLLFRAVSAPMAGSQTISGTLKGQFQFREGGASEDCRSQSSLRVIAPDGSVRGTLWDLDTNALGSDEFGSASTTYYNRQTPRGGAQTVTNVAITAGDRLVLEVGYRSHVTGSTVGNREVIVGVAPATFGDLPEDQTTTSDLGAYRGWIELSHDVSWGPDALEVSQMLVEVGVKVTATENRLEVSQVIAEASARVFAHGWGIIEVGEAIAGDTFLGTQPENTFAAGRDRGGSRATANGAVV